MARQAKVRAPKLQHARVLVRERSYSRIGFAVASAIAAAAVPHYRPALAADADGSGSGLQEVVVTARKVSENLQDVPISVGVLTKQDMQNLAITSFDDVVRSMPSLSYTSTGPGTQVLVIRGVSDGSNPNYANTSATGFLLDDMSLSWQGVQPDLHLYDMESIEVLNGPQGTTFGAGAMAGAVHYITNKPDVHAFSAGIDADAGQIQGGRTNQTYEGFLNVPLIDGVLGLRASAFTLTQGGFINNQLTTRTWYNGSVSNNADWARDNYNREYMEGGRIALRAVINDQWQASLTYGYQHTSTLGAWDEDPNLQPRTVERFGPESHEFWAKTADFHLDGDVGIGDLVFASTYWSLPTRQQNEYSQYMQNFAPAYSPNYGANSPPGTQEGLTCQHDPAYTPGGSTFVNCAPPLQTYEYHTNPERWSNELRLNSKKGGRLHWLGGLYWEKTRDKNSGSTYYIPNLKPDGDAFQYQLYSYGTTASSLPPGEWYAYTTRSDYLQTTEFANINFDITDKLNVEAGAVHFHSTFKYYSPYAQFAASPLTSTLDEGSSNKWNQKYGINYKFTDRMMAYAIFSQGFRDGGANSGLPGGCYASSSNPQGAPQSYVPDTVNNYELGLKSTWLNNHLLWNSALYQMDWKQLQTIIYDANVCPSSSYYVNVGNARIKGLESNADYKVNENLSMQVAVAYIDARVTSSPYESFQGEIGERLPYVPYFSWSGNVRYQMPIGAQLRGYGQFDIEHKGDMWNDLQADGSNGFPRMLQPEYSIMNVRFGLNPAGGAWLAELYVTNLADKNAIIFTNTGNFDLRETTNQPRTYGLRLNYRFGKETNAE